MAERETPRPPTPAAVVESPADTRRRQVLFLGGMRTGHGPRLVASRAAS